MKQATLLKHLRAIHPDITFELSCNCINVDAPRGFKFSANGCHCLCGGTPLPLDAPRKLINADLESSYDDIAERAAYGLEECDEGAECERCNEEVEAA